MLLQWCIAKNGGGYTQRGVAKGLKVPCLFMITEVSIRCQKNPGGWCTAYTRVYPPNTPLHMQRLEEESLAKDILLGTTPGTVHLRNTGTSTDRHHYETIG